MNANELANLLEVDSWYKLVTREEIATMLRQQQAEIEALKGEVAQLKHINKNWAISEGWALKEIEILEKKIQNMALDLLSAHAQADDHWVELERLRKAQEK